MISFPYAKINLGLRILRKRADGFHDLETCFFPVEQLCDALEMLPSGNEKSNLTTFNSDWEGPIENNLVWKAFELFRKLEGNLEGINWYLLKKIPSGGGLGGGSSDAAFALKMLAEKYGWQKNDPRLFEMASKLGSDCSFFLHNGPMMGYGRGEVLEPISILNRNFRIEFVFPGIHISTAQAFANIKPGIPEVSIATILAQPIETWKDELINDFEGSIFPSYPELKKIKEDLYLRGAIYASMSGSGSTIFGLFEV